MAVSANQLISRQAGDRSGGPIAASTRIYQGTMTFVTSAGYIDDDTGSGANRFSGIALEEYDNSSGSAGDLKAETWKRGIFALQGSGFTQADVGKNVYASDNFTVHTDFAAGRVYVGKVAEYVSATELMVEIDTDDDDLKATITVGAESTNVVNVAVQLQHANGAALGHRRVIPFYLSDDANGDSLIATAHSSGIAIGTDGVAIESVADKAGMLISESDGDVDIDITETGAKTAYLVLVLPDGRLVVSGAITHAA